jgi:molecular chaperone DnaK (HSP70)
MPDQVKSFLGIDFGTSNSAIAKAWTDEDGHPTVNAILSPTNLPQLPTAVYQDEATWYVGQDALDEAIAEREYLFTNFKTQLLHPNIKLSARNGDITIKDLTQKVIEQLLENARQDGKDLAASQIVVTHPVGSVWEKTMLGVYKELGLENIIPLSEPDAALYYAHNQLRIFDERERIILLIDFGGGTCDFSLLRVKYDGRWPSRRPKAQVIHPDYYELGGSNLDLLIAEKVLQTHDFDTSFLKELKGEHPETYHNFINKIKTAKERLSRKYNENNDAGQIANIILQIPRYDDIPLSFSARDLKDWTADKIKTAFQQIFFEGIPDAPNHIPLFKRQTIRNETIAPEDVSLILLTGGSSQFPWIYQDILPGMFRHLRNDGIHILDSPHLSVAYGAALYAYDRHFSNGKTRIPRRTVEPLKIILADGSEFELIPQGTELPVKIEMSFPMLQTQNEIVISLVIGDMNRASNRYVSQGKREFNFREPVQKGTIMSFIITIDELGEVRLNISPEDKPDISETKHFNMLELNWDNSHNRPSMLR